MEGAAVPQKLAAGQYRLRHFFGNIGGQQFPLGKI
jgi:hypothetical protein